MNNNPVVSAFLSASRNISGDGGGGAIGGGSVSGSSLEYSETTPSQLIMNEPRFFRSEPEDFYLTQNDKVETFNNNTIIENYESPNYDDDKRPEVSQSADRMSKHLRNSEISYLNKLFHKNRKDKKKTIMDMKLGEIMENTSNFFNDFIRDYRHKIHDTEVVLKKETEEGFYQSLQIYIIAFVRYVNENDNIIYLGIILIFISIILYFFNITSNITIVKNE